MRPLSYKLTTIHCRFASSLSDVQFICIPAKPNRQGLWLDVAGQTVQASLLSTSGRRPRLVSAPCDGLNDTNARGDETKGDLN